MGVVQEWKPSIVEFVTQDSDTHKMQDLPAMLAGQLETLCRAINAELEQKGKSLRAKIDQHKIIFVEVVQE